MFLCKLRGVWMLNSSKCACVCARVCVWVCVCVLVWKSVFDYSLCVNASSQRRREGYSDQVKKNKVKCLLNLFCSFYGPLNQWLCCCRSFCLASLNVGVWVCVCMSVLYDWPDVFQWSHVKPNLCLRGVLLWVLGVFNSWESDFSCCYLIPSSWIEGCIVIRLWCIFILFLAITFTHSQW